jgi:DNA polymerase IV
VCHSFNYPKAILHIDGDAFFASCEQARDPSLKGRPVITGKERGIAASMSYEAKARGVTRAMPLHEIQKLCPDAIIMPSDYETYSLLSKRFYEIVRRYTPDVEEYGIDECFADITGLRRYFHTSYEKISEMISNDLSKELGFNFSIGLASTKVLAKVGSKFNKPHGLVAIPMQDIEKYLKNLYVEKIWGIGSQTTAFLAKYRIETAWQFAHQTEEWIRHHLAKPHHEIWQELNGHSVLPLNVGEKTSYASIQKVKTFTPPSTDKNFIFAQLCKNIENACIKARRYKLAARNVIIFLRRQTFRDRGIEIKLSRPSCFPNEVIAAIRKGFDMIYEPNILYRSTGVTIFNLLPDNETQPDLFDRFKQTEKLSKIFESVDEIKQKYGKHTIFLGSSFAAHKFEQHLGNRGDRPKRTTDLFKGETVRKRLAVPMFTGEVI